MYFHYKSLVENDMRGAWPVWTPGAPLVAFIAGVHERPHIYTLMQTHINPEMTAIRPIPLLLPHHHKSVPGEKRVGNQP